MPTAEAGEASIHYEVVGSGAPVVLVAGTGYPGATWPQAVIDPLVERWAAVTFDQRGTGLSQGTDGPYTTRLFASDVAAIVDDLGLGPAHVIGHSMGGRVAQWLAVDRPDTVASLVLAASGPGHGGDTAHAGTGVPIRTVLRLVDEGYEGFIRGLQRRTFFTDGFADTHASAVSWLGDAFWQNRPDLENYLKHVIARQTHDSSGVLGAIRAPTLVIVGEEDTHEGDTGSHVDQSRYLAERIEGATLEMVPGVRHGLFWEHPERSMAPIVGFLVGVDGP